MYKYAVTFKVSGYGLAQPCKVSYFWRQSCVAVCVETRVLLMLEEVYLRFEQLLVASGFQMSRAENLQA